MALETKAMVLRAIVPLLGMACVTGAILFSQPKPASAQIFPQHAAPSMNYTIHCSGCHKSDGSGEDNLVPDFRNNVARFTQTPDGRAYLVRVPGSSNSFLSDKDLATLLNYILATYDPKHVPANFKPYTEAEIKSLRSSPLSAALTERARILEELKTQGS